jgi:hypothetical protein
MTFWRRLTSGLGTHSVSTDLETDADLRDALARVEKFDPKWTTQKNVRKPNDDSSPGRFYRELVGSGTPHRYWGAWNVDEVLNDGPWCILMTFTQYTPDGTLTTYVYSSSHFALVKVVLGHVELATLAYADTDKGELYPPYSGGSSEVMETVLGHNCINVVGRLNPMAVQYVRQWIRRRLLPEFEKAKIEIESARQQDTAHLEVMRKKYLP